MEIVVFTGLALVALISALLVITQRSPVYSALCLILTLGSVAGLFVLLGAEFVAAVQVIVYAGAIVVLFLFVIMLLDLKREESPWARLSRRQLGTGIALGGLLLAELVLVVGRRLLAPEAAVAPPPALGNTQAIGRLLFTDYLLPFEVTSVILLIAIVGAMVLAKQHLD